MGIHNQSTRNVLADIDLGIRVDRATEAIPVTSDTLFNVVGGRIALMGMVGEVTSVMDGTATTLLVVANPTAAGTSSPLCGASGALNAQARGARLSLPAAVGTGMLLSATHGAAVVAQHPPWLIEAGTIDLTVGVGANAGLISWTVWYLPVDDGAYVEVAA
jgi:hypothetical protein